MTIHGQYPTPRHQRRRRQRLVSKLVLLGAVGFAVGTVFSGMARIADRSSKTPLALVTSPIGASLHRFVAAPGLASLNAASGRPTLSPLPRAEEVWECEVVVVGGSLGGVAAASHAMASGAQTCLIELTPWLGGQISSQGVPAIDESRNMRWRQNFSESWSRFKQLIRSQPIDLPDWTGMGDRQWVFETNSCWVGDLCFLPEAGANAAQAWLQRAAASAPGSRWATATAFKGALFDPSGQNLIAVYAVKRTPKDPQYVPSGQPSQELPAWYAWSDTETFEKTSIRLQPPAGQKMSVIDATDTGEVVAWAQVPHRIGSDAQALLGEYNAPSTGNPACTQAFTFPFAIAILDDLGASRQALKQLETTLNKVDYRRAFDMEGFPMFHNRGLFNYRRIVSRNPGRAAVSRSTPGEITLVNWNRGNDWNIMDNPLIMDASTLAQTQQYQNWMGGVSIQALKLAEENALLFAEWLLELQATSAFPLTFLSGENSPLGTQSGLSMVPYIREGRRIVGRAAYGQPEFMIREPDLRLDMPEGRNFAETAIALAHYDIDIHGCRYRNWQPSNEATRAGVNERVVRPLQIPLEALIPIGVDNLLIGGKSIAVSHIANAMTRTHYNEWSIGAAAGATAGWWLQQSDSDPLPAQMLEAGQVLSLQAYLRNQGLRWTW